MFLIPLPWLFLDCVVKMVGVREQIKVFWEVVEFVRISSS
jgi:hypothetical protein